MKVVVTGGNGFIGREVCRRAVAEGHDVTSIARSGRPGTGSGPWANDVRWVEADVFAPHKWRDRLVNGDAVVHSIGISSERPADGVTFERVNGDAGILVALEAERVGVDRFVYISSSTKPPLVREAYIEAKRRAEDAIQDLDMAVSTLRPGPVYGPGQPHFPKVANLFFAAVGRVGPIARRIGADRPLPVDAVGHAAYAMAAGEYTATEPVAGNEIAARFG